MTSDRRRPRSAIRLAASTAAHERDERALGFSIWVPEWGDQMDALVINDSGGTPLFALPPADAIALLVRWFWHHRARYFAHEQAEAARRKMHRVAPPAKKKRRAARTRAG